MSERREPPPGAKPLYPDPADELGFYEIARERGMLDSQQKRKDA